MAANWIIYGCCARSHPLVAKPVVSVSQTVIFMYVDYFISKNVTPAYAGILHLRVRFRNSTE